MKNIAVFFGGVSSEHDISIITGVQTASALDKEKYNVFPIYISKSGDFYLCSEFENVEVFLDFNQKKFKKCVLLPSDTRLFIKSLRRNGGKFNAVCDLDVAVICCHGMNGEDGTLQGFLELVGLPYTSSGVLGSSVCMDKIIMKKLFEAENLPITKYVWFTKTEFENEQKTVLSKINKDLKFPLVVKPANLGSSIGISRCKTKSELIKGIEIACHYDQRIIVEEGVQNLREINCACIGNEDRVQPSELEEPISWEKFLTFEDKYLHFSGVKQEQSKISKNVTEVDLQDELKEQIKEFSKTAFSGLCCSGVVRIDFLLNDETKEIFINEINTVPGSLANYLWEGIDYTTLLDILLEIAETKHNLKKQCCFSYDSDVLKKFKDTSKKTRIAKGF